MKYVCDLWYGTGREATPYGIVFFEHDTFPTQEEAGNILMKKIPFLQNSYITDKSLSYATPGGKKGNNPKHFCSISFEIDGDKRYDLYYTNIRPVVEDKKPDKMNLYT